MQRFFVPLVVALMGFAVPGVQAAGKVAWAKGYPKSGQKPGEIVIKGKAVPDAGHKLMSAVLSYGINGGEFQTKKLKMKADGTIEEAVITHLAPGNEYAVHLIVTQKPENGEEPSDLALVGFVTATNKKKK